LKFNNKKLRHLKKKVLREGRGTAREKKEKAWKREKKKNRVEKRKD